MSTRSRQSCSKDRCSLEPKSRYINIHIYTGIAWALRVINPVARSSCVKLRLCCCCCWLAVININSELSRMEDNYNKCEDDKAFAHFKFL